MIAYDSLKWNFECLLNFSQGEIGPGIFRGIFKKS